MSKIIIASKNPVKIQAVTNGFAKMFPDQQYEVQGISVPSGVSDQPLSDKETLTGSINRVKNTIATVPDADFWVGIEGGIMQTSDTEMQAFAWIVVQSHNGKIGKGKTSTFFLPPRVVELIQQGKELGEADDIVFGRTNSKQQNGAVGILTGDVIDRTTYYTEAVILALIPFKNPTLF